MNLKSLSKIILFSSISLLSLSVVSCDNTPSEEVHNHIWDEGVITKKATCESDGEITYTCKDCNETKTEVVVGKHNFVDNDCTICGKQDYTEGLYFVLYSKEYYVVSIGKARDENIVIPTTLNGFPVTGIKMSGFKNCSFIKSITMPESITVIGEEAFAGCSSLESIILPKSITSISSYAFSSCESLKSINIPYGINVISEGAFAGCSSLTSIDIPEGVTDIKFAAFNNCSSLENINIPNSVTNIGNWTLRGSYVFGGCTSLKTITLPDNIISLNPGLFQNCSNLTSVIIGNNVKYIYDYAFNNCDSLTTIYFKGSEEQWNSIEISQEGNSALDNVTVVYNYEN